MFESRINTGGIWPPLAPPPKWRQWQLLAKNWGARCCRWHCEVGTTSTGSSAGFIVSGWRMTMCSWYRTLREVCDLIVTYNNTLARCHISGLFVGVFIRGVSRSTERRTFIEGRLLPVFSFMSSWTGLRMIANWSSSVSADVRFVSVMTAMTPLSVRSTVLNFSEWNLKSNFVPRSKHAQLSLLLSAVGGSKHWSLPSSGIWRHVFAVSRPLRCLELSCTSHSLTRRNVRERRKR